VARSSRPSPLKSPATIDSGRSPAAYGLAGWNVPSPLPRSTETPLDPELEGSPEPAAAKRSRPAPLPTPATRLAGSCPDPDSTPGWNVPSPWPRNTEMSPESEREPELAVARSGRPSPLKSPTTRPAGKFPAGYDTAGWNVPSPSPSSTEMPLDQAFA